MVLRRLLTASILILVLPLAVHADVLFEGYSKILSGEEHIGYVVTRYEYDAKKKNFTGIYFQKTGKGPSETTESLKAVAGPELAPISYEYTLLSGKEVKTIDAKFKADTLVAVVKANGKVQRIERKIPKGTFLSVFLVYVMLKSKEGLKSDAHYEYQAIAEEEAATFKGQALVGKEEMFNGFRVFKINNTFKDAKFLSYVNERGEVLGTNSLGQAISAELVETPSDAIANQSYSANILKALFGNVPAGDANVKARAKKLKEVESQPTPPIKGGGVPQGQGIMIKTAPEKEESKGQNR